ncbi:hypothetical protein Q1695_011557 [Nippostrongylus brasiliensis]|nr:hypothetical protein Q1695_011557 [Nippostrongylus brasiliensis]
MGLLSCVERRHRLGTSVALDSSCTRLSTILSTLTRLSPRLATLRLHSLHQKTISVIDCYSPHAAADDSELDAFCGHLEEVIRNEKFSYKCIVGDFNAMIGKGNGEDYRIGRLGIGDKNELGNRLVDLMSATRLFHSNSLFEKKEHRRWTWDSPNGTTHAKIDHILTNRRWSLYDTHETCK